MTKASSPPDPGAASGPGATLGRGDPLPEDILDTSRAGGIIIRGSVLRLGGYVAGVALSVAAVALLTRHLGSGDFGRYTTVVALVTVVAGLTEAGMTNIGVREYSVQVGEARARLMRDLLGLRLVLTGLGVGVAVGFAVVAGYDEVMVAGTALAGAGLVLVVLQATYGVPLQAELRLGWVTATEVLRQLVTVAAIVLLVAAGAALLPFLAVPLMATVPVLALTLPLVRGKVPLLPAFKREQWASLLRVTLPYAAATAVGAIYAYLAVVMMSLVSTSEETGYFGAAFRIFIVLGGIPGLLVVSAFPVLARAARDDHARLAYALQRLWDISLLIGTGLVICTVIGAELAIDIVGGEAFEPSVAVLRILAGAVLASYLVATWGYALLSLGRYRALLIANGVALASSGILTVTLAPSFGARGAAVAVLVGETLVAAGYGIALMRHRADLRPKLEIVPKVALAAAVATLAGLVVPGPDAVALVVTTVVYLGLAVLIRAVPPEIGEAFLARRSEG